MEKPTWLNLALSSSSTADKLPQEQDYQNHSEEDESLLDGNAALAQEYACLHES